MYLSPYLKLQNEIPYIGTNTILHTSGVAPILAIGTYYIVPNVLRRRFSKLFNLRTDKR